MGPPPVAKDVGAGQISAIVSADGPVADPASFNNTSTAYFEVVQPPIDVGLLRGDPDNTDGVMADGPLDFTDLTPTLPAKITAKVVNPGPGPALVTLVVTSDNPLATSGDAESASLTWTLEESPVVGEPPRIVPDLQTFTFTVTRPPAGSNIVVGFTATLTVVPPVTDPDPSNNTGTAEVDLSFPVTITSTPEGALRITDGFYRGPRTPTVIGAGVAHARPLVGPVAASGGANGGRPSRGAPADQACCRGRCLAGGHQR